MLAFHNGFHLVERVHDNQDKPVRQLQPMTKETYYRTRNIFYFVVMIFSKYNFSDFFLILLDIREVLGPNFKQICHFD